MPSKCSNCGKKCELTQVKGQPDEYAIPKDWGVITRKLDGGVWGDHYCPECYKKLSK